MKSLHIFKPGSHVAMSGDVVNFTEADLAATVLAYKPSLHEAPLVIGHPKHDAPAAGWVKALAAGPEGLFATPDQVDPAFAEQVAKGSFKKISASFYHPDSPSNPVPGVYYLRHVGFLGAQPPAVKGLRPIELAEGEDGVVEFADFGHETSANLWRRLRDWIIGERGLAVADEVIPSWQIETLNEVARREDEPRPSFTEPTPPAEEPPVTPEEIAAMQAENERLQRQVQQHQEDQRKSRQATVHAASVAFAEQLVAAGMEARHVPVIVAALDFAEASDSPLEFGEGEQRQPLTAGLKAAFSDLAGAVSFAERATKDRVGGGQSTAAELEFSEVPTDPERLKLHSDATALAAEKGITYELAVRQLISQ